MRGPTGARPGCTRRGPAPLRCPGPSSRARPSSWRWPSPPGAAPARARLAAGPGNVGAAFGIGLELNGADLTAPGPLWLAAPAAGMREALLADGVAAAARVGVAYAGAGWSDRPWRFGVRDHASLSRPFPRSG